MFKLTEWMKLIRMQGVRQYRIPQCEYGARAVKLSDFVGSLCLDGMATSCSHESRRWRIPWAGKLVVGPHPPAMGTQWAIPEAGWHRGLRRSKLPPGPYVTKSLAHYPSELNRELARRLVEQSARVVAADSVPQDAAVHDSTGQVKRKWNQWFAPGYMPRRGSVNASERPAEAPVDGFGKPLVQFSLPLTGQRPAASQSDDTYPGSLRNTYKTVMASQSALAGAHCSKRA